MFDILNWQCYINHKEFGACSLNAVRQWLPE